ncbi:MAG: efflux RND transporter periplasmic adaptor subunit [Bacteroidia bacterium]|nr:efflux RND transporter periplasmic adaptor subunit [Bacteroidia bacterium]
MMRFIKHTILMGCTILLVGSCHNHDHTHDGHNHGNEIDMPQGTSYTLRGNRSELFVEFPALLTNQNFKIAAHFTDLISFKAIENGLLTVKWSKMSDSTNKATKGVISSPGIFQVELNNSSSGNYRIIFTLKTELFEDTFEINDINVYDHYEEADNTTTAINKGDEVSFLKEQQWNTEFAVTEIQRKSINNIIHTSGEIQAVKGDEKYLIAKSSGIVYIMNKNLQEGRDVKAGDNLFKVDSKGLMLANLKEKFNIARSTLDQSKMDFQRAEKLYEQKIIGRKELEKRKMDYEIALSQFQTLKDSYTPGGQYVKAPVSGFIKKLMIHDGQYVEEGTPLLEISTNKKLILQADVSQKYLPQLPLIKTANFKTAFMEEVQSIEDYNGKMVSYGKSLVDHTHLIPVLFELDNLADLVPGSFVEIFLETTPIEDQLVVPLSALLIDFNSSFVYVQTSGESFEKREIEPGLNDGINIQVLKGLEEGDWVVTTGAYQLKMASMSSSIPSHGHEH